MRVLPTGSLVVGKLPKGCELCQRGLKTVIFVTGMCPRRCFYCPLSRERRRDVFLVNEVKLKADNPKFVNSLISEIYRSASLGASLTGGDPLIRLERTLHVIQVIREFLGDEFHLHLYTTGKTLTVNVVKKLERVGLDELRVHPDLNDLPKIAEALRGSAIEYGLEVPALPRSERMLTRLVAKAEKMGFKFVNINELEFSEENSVALLQRGYTMSDDYISAIGSKETAAKVLKRAEREGIGIDLHFCPVIVKDKYQTGLRLFRRGQVTAKPYERVTDFGTIIRLEVTNMREMLKGVPKALYKLRDGKVLTSIDMLPLIKGKEVYLVEELSSSDRLEISRERIHLAEET